MRFKKKKATVTVVSLSAIQTWDRTVPKGNLTSKHQMLLLRPLTENEYPISSCIWDDCLKWSFWSCNIIPTHSVLYAAKSNNVLYLGLCYISFTHSHNTFICSEAELINLQHNNTKWIYLSKGYTAGWRFCSVANDKRIGPIPMSLLHSSVWCF